MMMRQDDEALLNGTMSEGEYRERQEARGAGALVGARVVATVFTGDRILAAIPGVATAIKNAFVVNAKTGLAVNQTKAVAGVFGKGADGAKSVIAVAGKPGFSLPKGVTEKTLQAYRNVATRAIESGKPAEVQKLRIEAIDKALEALKD